MSKPTTLNASLPPPEGVCDETNLAEAVIALRLAMLDLVEKQSVLMDKFDGFVMRVMAHEERLKRLEDSLLTHLECATWVKATIRFLPLVVAAFVFLLGRHVNGGWV